MPEVTWSCKSCAGSLGFNPASECRVQTGLRSSVWWAWDLMPFRQIDIWAGRIIVRHEQRAGCRRQANAAQDGAQRFQALLLEGV